MNKQLQNLIKRLNVISDTIEETIEVLESVDKLKEDSATLEKIAWMLPDKDNPKMKEKQPAETKKRKTRVKIIDEPTQGNNEPAEEEETTTETND